MVPMLEWKSSQSGQLVSDSLEFCEVACPAGELEQHHMVVLPAHYRERIR